MKTRRILLTRARWLRKPRPYVGLLAVVAAMAIAPVVGEGLLRGQARDTAGQSAPTPAPAANAQAPAEPQATKPLALESAVDAPKTKIAADAAQLLQLATDLKTEVDKTTKDTLSITVVRKADQIEQLAHKVRNNR